VQPVILNSLLTNVVKLRGFGPYYAALLRKLCGDRYLDILFHSPSSVIERINISELEDKFINKRVILKGIIKSIWTKNPKISVITVEVYNDKLSIIYFNVNKTWLRNTFKKNKTICFSGELNKRGKIWQIAHPDYVTEDIKNISIPDFDATYPLTKGLSLNKFKIAIKESIKFLPRFDEWINQDLLKKKKWYSLETSIKHLHFPINKKDLNNKDIYIERIAYDEALSKQLALNLIRKYKNKIIQRSLNINNNLKNKLTKILPFTLTSDQNKVLKEIYDDLNKSTPMFRLLQGDVGSGKTVVALFSLIHVVEAEFQGALMAPTEILAKQHYNFFKTFEAKLNINVSLLTSKISNQEKKIILKDIRIGKINIIIGTHSIIQKDVIFKNLRLAIIDEQHRFGVHQRLELIKKSPDTDFMLMTATPIPRTLILANYGDMDLSILYNKPQNRPKIKTISVSIPRIKEIIKAINRAIEKGDQIFWVCPLVNDSEKLDLAAAESRAKFLENYFPNKISLVHGQMNTEERDIKLNNFANNKKPILVSTTVIEVGIDIPNATVMIIEHAERFGLAQLHQLRGRIGRGNKESICILLYDTKIGNFAKERISVMRETTDGFVISEKDLKLRGAGEVLGTRQSGEQNFKILNMNIHESLIKIADKEAKIIVNKNSSLSGVYGKKLRILLYLFEQNKAINLIKSG
tara:strand:+ start:2115 stop:4190 length:2076 start_codon:yes stop_codon:yes gene_type:complete